MRRRSALLDETRQDRRQPFAAPFSQLESQSSRSSQLSASSPPPVSVSVSSFSMSFSHATTFYRAAEIKRSFDDGERANMPACIKSQSFWRVLIYEACPSHIISSTHSCLLTWTWTWCRP